MCSLDPCRYEYTDICTNGTNFGQSIRLEYGIGLEHRDGIRANLRFNYFTRIPKFGRKSLSANPDAPSCRARIGPNVRLTNAMNHICRETGEVLPCGSEPVDCSSQFFASAGLVQSQVWKRHFEHPKKKYVDEQAAKVDDGSFQFSEPMSVSHSE
jgi:hypothetical protein